MTSTPMNPAARVGRLMLNDVLLEGRGLLVAAASVAGAVILIWGLLPAGYSQGAYEGFVYPWTLILGGYLFTSGSFAGTHRRDRGIDFFMLPAAHWEKFTSKVLQTSVLYTLAVVLFCVVLSGFVSLVRLAMGREFVQLFNPFTKEVLHVSVAYFVSHAVFLYGSASFGSRAFIKTALMGIAFLVATMFYLSLVGRVVAPQLAVIDQDTANRFVAVNWERLGTIGRVVGYVLLYSVTPYFWALTYLRLRETEV